MTGVVASNLHASPTNGPSPHNSLLTHDLGAFQTGVRIPPGRNPQQLALLLQALAGVTPLVTAPFDRFLMREMPRVPYGATVVIITAVMNSDLHETILRIKQRGRQIVLISLAKEYPPEISGVQVVHVPFSEEMVSDIEF